jgi:hypothetical protein
MAEQIKKMLSWSDSSDDENGDEEVKQIKKQIINQRQKHHPVVNEPQFLSRKVDGNRINNKYLRVSIVCGDEMFQG